MSTSVGKLKRPADYIAEQADKIQQVVDAFNVPVEAVAVLAERLFARRLESASTVTRDEADALLRTRGLQLAERLIQEAGESLSSEEAARRLGATRQTVNDKKKRGELLAFKLPVGRGDRFPMWQFDGKHVRQWVPKVIEHLGNGFEALSFLLARRQSLNGQRFLDLALSGDEAAIHDLLDLASRNGESA